MAEQERKDEDEQERFQRVKLEGMAAVASVECHLMNDIVFIGIVTTTGYNEDKAKRFLEEFHEAITRHYQNNLVFIKKQDNLRPNIFDKKFTPDFKRIMSNHDTGIEMGTIDEAQNQVDEIRQIAERATSKQLNNLAEGERLLKTTQQMNELAQEFQKDAHKMETIMQNQSWWMCSKKCILMIGGAILGLFLVILVATWAICGHPLCL